MCENDLLRSILGKNWWERLVVGSEKKGGCSKLNSGPQRHGFIPILILHCKCHLIWKKGCNSCN